MNNDQTTTLFEKIGTWIRNSIMLKLITITFLMLLLLIPASMVQSIISEREALNEQATEEVSSLWANNQLIEGPILAIPMRFVEEKEDKVQSYYRTWYVLPETLDVTGQINPEKLHRGIYEVVVYDSRMKVSGNFELPAPPSHDNLAEIQWDKASILIGISDLRGIKNDLKVGWNNNTYPVSPAHDGISVDIPPVEENGSYHFNFTLDLQGSKNLSFIPVGSVTDVTISSPWPAPKFEGNFLPDSREVTSNGFEASWTILELNRNFPQSYWDNSYENSLYASSFGVDLLMPMDNYKKSDRTSKYAVMTITLTFLIFFLIEILNKHKIHPFQYALVGLALCLFYVLLVSISEHQGFNAAYAISASGVIGIVTLYSRTIFRTTKQVVLLFLMLIVIYGFMFITIQLVDYALLIGSIGLTIMLAATMYFTRNINWYQIGRQELTTS